MDENWLHFEYDSLDEEKNHIPKANEDKSVIIADK